MPHQTLAEELHPVRPQQLRQRTHLCENTQIITTNAIQQIFFITTENKDCLRACVCVCTRDVGVFLSVESQFVLCGKVDEGLHGGEVGDVSVADLTEQRLQVPTRKQRKHMF